MTYVRYPSAASISLLIYHRITIVLAQLLGTVLPHPYLVIHRFRYKETPKPSLREIPGSVTDAFNWYLF